MLKDRDFVEDRFSPWGDLKRGMIAGIAHAFFVCAWADEEEQKGRSYPGMELTEVAPDTPLEAVIEAAIFLGHFEEVNGASAILSLYHAARAEGVSDDEWVDGSWAEDHAIEFGWYLGMQGLGHGVSWSDDHAEFEMKIPHFEYYL